MYTAIIHPLRKALNLSMNEYAVLDSIMKLSTNNKSGGWCTKTKQYIGDTLDLSERTVRTIIKTLLAKGLIEEGEINRALRTTDSYNTLFHDKDVKLLALDDIISINPSFFNKPEETADKRKRKMFPVKAEDVAESTPYIQYINSTYNTPEFEKKSNIGEEEKISTTKRSEASPKNKKKENNPPLPPDPPNKEKKPKTNPLFQSFKQSFIDKYESISGQEFYWRAKDSVAINSLITQTKFAYTTSGTPQPTDEQMLDGINAILNRALTDPWMKDNFEPSIISSKFNILKSKYYGKRQTGISEADIDRIVNEFNSD